MKLKLCRLSPSSSIYSWCGLPKVLKFSEPHRIGLKINEITYKKIPCTAGVSYILAFKMNYYWKLVTFLGSRSCFDTTIKHRRKQGILQENYPMLFEQERESQALLFTFSYPSGQMRC